MIVRIALASSGPGGLEERVADRLARAPYFTIIDVEDCKTVGMRSVRNTAISFSHGAGPIAVKMMLDEGVSILVGPAPGESVATLLREHGIRLVEANPGKPLHEALRKALALLGC